MTGVANPLTGYLLVAALLFAIGLAGALTRRNAILVLIGIELMLNAANLEFNCFLALRATSRGADGDDVRDFFDRCCGCRSCSGTGVGDFNLSPCAHDGP